MIGITDEGKWFGTYDKSHLVPFGEYTPFKNILPLDKLTPGNTDFSKGSGLKTIKMPNLPPFSPLICYEVIFSANVKNKKDKPKWLLNLTNDGWYGLSTGPYQHFELSRLRAIEEGLPLVRVANTGISGLVDGTGRVLKVFPLNIKGNIDFKLVKNISNETLFLRHGNKIPLFLLTVFPFLVAILSREKPLIAQT
jgi:apolipoprotein N-acyltransferase